MVMPDIGDGRNERIMIRDKDVPLNRNPLLEGDYPDAPASAPYPSTCLSSPKSARSRMSTGDVELSRTPTLSAIAPYRLEEKKDDVEVPELSRTRMVLIALGMMLTYFLGVSFSSISSLQSDIGAKRQTASTTAVTMVIPQIARDLEITELEAQWVRDESSFDAHLIISACQVVPGLGRGADVQVSSAYSLAYGWCVTT
jgi:hypothetical protein